MWYCSCDASVRADWPAERASTLRCRAQAPTQQTPVQTPLTQKVGAVKSINGNALVLTADGGSDVSVTVASNAKIVQVAPGEKDLKSATPIALTDLQVGDRILVRGRASDDAKTMTAVGIIAMKSKDLEAKKAQDRERLAKARHRRVGERGRSRDGHDHNFHGDRSHRENRSDSHDEEYGVAPLRAGFGAVR